MTTLRPIDSFRQYFLDVKPYHTKILEVVEKYNFQEDLPVNIEESIFFNIEYKNDPLCKTVGYGFVWDEECGFDAVDCCDLFDCIGGYGLIFDNSDLVVSIPINTVNADMDTVVVPGNHVYDVKNQIDSIPAYDTIIVNGDLTPYFAYHKLFVILPVRTLYVVENTAGEIKIKGNYAAELVNERVFKLYNTSEDDGLYNVIQASYDSIFDLTTIVLADSQQVTPDLSNGIIEYNIGTKNNGAYLVDSHSFDGTSTTITLNSTTNVSFTNTTEGRNHGSIQLRTGLSPGRYIDLDVGNDSDGVYKILQSSYSGNSNETTVYVASDILHDAVGGWVRMYGYVNEGGFDGDGECSTPKHSNIKVGISERLVIEVVGPPAVADTPIELVFNILADNDSIILPVTQYAFDGSTPMVYNCVVDWGDTTSDVITAWDQAETTHQYATAGTYVVTITGQFDRLSYGGGYTVTKAYSRNNLAELRQWGTNVYKDFTDVLYFCGSALLTATDAPNLSQCTSMHGAFSSANSVTGDFTGWDVSTITDMEDAFRGADLTNADFTGWDVSNVTNMEGCFQNTTAAGMNVSDWNVGAVTNFRVMFDGSGFNGDVSAWNVSNALDMSYMFSDTSDFNSNISGWTINPIGPVNMNSMFYQALVFNQPIGSWNMSAVTDIDWMFGTALLFNQSLTTWDITGCNSLESVFNNAQAFNGDVSGWDTSGIGTFYACFSTATSFAQPLTGWDFTGVNSTLSGRYFMAFMTYPTARYDELLNHWAASSPYATTNVRWDITSSNYTIATSQAARDTLTGAPDNWAIYDLGGI